MNSPGRHGVDASLPAGWVEVAIGDALEHFAERVELLSDVEYNLISVRRRHGGMFHRERLAGRAILTKSVQRVVPGSFVIARRQIVHGACAIAAPEFEDSIMSMSYSAFRGSPICDARYFFALAQQPYMVRYFWNSSHGVVVEKLNFQQDEWLAYPVGLPPLKEQRRVLEILDTIDETIRATERVIVKRQSMLMGLAAELFNLRSRSGEWAERPLAQWTELGTPITYGIVQAGPHVPNGVPYIRTGDMGTELRRDGLLCTSPKIAESYRRSRVSAGDIVCAIRATVGKVLMVPPELDGANLTQGTARIAPAADVDGHCLLWALRSESVTAQIRSIQKGTTFQEITLQRLRSLAVRLPARRDDQEKLASVLRSAEGIVRAEQTSLVALKATRAGLAADLLSGRVRTAAA